jgi:hypothetical protein
MPPISTFLLGLRPCSAVGLLEPFMLDTLPEPLANVSLEVAFAVFEKSCRLTDIIERCKKEGSSSYWEQQESFPIPQDSGDALLPPTARASLCPRGDVR